MMKYEESQCLTVMNEASMLSLIALMMIERTGRMEVMMQAMMSLEENVL
jgi:hypothetical protein